IGLTLAVLLGSACVTVRPAPVSTVVVPEGPNEVISSEDEFVPALEPYGEWVWVSGLGRVWRPSTAYVGSGWQPYSTGGNWVETRVGWTFVSSYPFGWAVFHYGRWWSDPLYGWVWVPGTTWGPAWV